MQAGLRHHQSGLFDTAKTCYHQALAADPRQPDALHLLGVIAHQTGDNHIAAELIGKAIEINPSFASYHSNLGNVLQVLGRFDACIAAYEDAIRLAPDFAEAHYNLGNAHLALGSCAAALAAYDAALRLKPDYTEAMSNRGNALTGLGRPNDAIESYEAAISLRPDYVPAHHKLGNARMAQQDFTAALTAYDGVLRLDPNHADGLSGRGIALLSLGNPADALDSFEAAIRLTADLATAHYNLGTALYALNRFDKAITAYESALRLHPDYPDAQSRLYFALYRRHEEQGQYETAFAHLREANRLRHSTIPYDEAMALRLMKRIENVFTPTLLSRAAPRGGPVDVPIFILGMPRSGSTLVEQILVSHRSVGGGGELTTLVDTIIGRGRFAGQPYPENIPLRSDAELSAAAAAYRARLQALAPSAARITDKQPANFHHVGLIRLALPGAKIIHIRRDPVDTCFSCFAQNFDEGQPFTNDLAELGRYYRAYARLMAHWRTTLPLGAMLEIDYEALVADFEPQVRRILEYCELDWDPACLTFYEHERPVLTTSALQVRQKLYGHAVGRTEPYGPLLDELCAILNAPF